MPHDPLNVDDTLVACSICHAEIRLGDTVEATDQDTILCGGCGRSNYRCCWCDTTHHRSGMFAVSLRGDRPREPRLICEDCHNNGFWCNGCDSFYPEHEAHRVDDDDYILCGTCAREHITVLAHERRNPYFGSHGSCSYQKTRIRSKSFNDMPFKRFFGFELELTGAGGADIAKLIDTTGYGITQDGSVNKEGIEIQTRVMQGDTGLTHLRFACEMLEKAGATVDKSCGLHLHMDASDLMEEDLIKIYMLYYQVQRFLFSMQPTSRRDNHFCYEITPEELNRVCSIGPAAHLYEDNAEMENLDQKVMQREADLCQKKEKKDNTWRYCFVNLHAYYYLNTVEIRNHSGTYEYDKLRNWALINLALIETAKEKSREWMMERMDATKFLSIMPNDDVRAYIQGRWKKFGIINKRQPSISSTIETNNCVWRDGMTMFNLEGETNEKAEVQPVRSRPRRRAGN